MSDRLMDALDAPDARKWEGDSEGDFVIGTILKLGTFTGEYGTSPTVIIQVQSGQEGGQPMEEGESVIFYASATVARNELENADPRAGDRIGVKYHGTATGKSGNDYKKFKVAVERVDRLQGQLDEPPAESGDGSSGGW